MSSGQSVERPHFLNYSPDGLIKNNNERSENLEMKILENNRFKMMSVNPY